jgi:hypothetical protein
MAGLQESVAEKKAELEFLKMVERVHSVVGAQVWQSCIILFLRNAYVVLVTSSWRRKLLNM